MQNQVHVMPRSGRPEEKPKREINSSMTLEDQVAALDALIKSPPQNSRVIEFSPKLAEYILANLNQNNRKRKPAKIKKYASDLAEGVWGLTGDTVKFGSNGMLRDGQNRLAACVRADRPLRTHTVFGIDPQLFPRMDIGKNRNGADVFSIAGIDYANHASAAVRWLLILTGDDPSDRGAQFSNEELLKAHRETFDGDRIEQSIQRALPIRRACGHPVGPLAALHYLFSQKDQKKADAFYDEWASGRAKSARAPARYLQRRLVEIANASSNRIHESVRNAMIIKAWNAYVEGRSVSKADMQHAASDQLPKIEG